MAATLSPGLHAGIFEARYHADDLCAVPTLSRSVAHTLLTRSPAHAWAMHPRLNPSAQAEHTPALDFGRIAHSIVLTGTDPCKVIEADDWRTKAAQQARDEAREAGLVPMLRRDHQTVVAMTQALHRFLARHPARDAFYAGRPEMTAIYEDAGVMCRARFDMLPDDPAAPVVDYKTTRNAEPQAFARAIWTYGYDLQAAWYTRALKVLRGRAPERFILLAQEKAPPYAVTAHALDEAAFEHAEARVDEALSLWRGCLASNQWPAYEPIITPVGPPPWAYDREASMTFTEGDAA